MATPQASSILSTDVPLSQSPSAALLHINATPNVHNESQSRSRPSTATSNSNQTTGQFVPMDPGAVSNSIHHGANSILDLIRAERKQVFEDSQRQFARFQQQCTEKLTLSSREL